MRIRIRMLCMHAITFYNNIAIFIIVCANVRCVRQYKIIGHRRQWEWCLFYWSNIMWMRSSVSMRQWTLPSHRITSLRFASKRSIFIQIIWSAIDRAMEMFDMHADKNNMNSISLVRMSSRNAIHANNALHSAAFNVNSFEFHTS